MHTMCRYGDNDLCAAVVCDQQEKEVLETSAEETAEVAEISHEVRVHQK